MHGKANLRLELSVAAFLALETQRVERGDRQLGEQRADESADLGIGAAHRERHAVGDQAGRPALDAVFALHQVEAGLVRESVDALMARVATRLLEIPAPSRAPREETLAWPMPVVDDRVFSVEPEGQGWRVRGRKIERLISMTNFAQPEALRRIERVLQASGISNALRAAGECLGNHRLGACQLFATIEPCAMCVGALVQARIARLVYGADDPKAGAVHSALTVLNHPCLNHRIEVVGGVLAGRCTELIQTFFRERRGGADER